MKIYGGGGGRYIAIILDHGIWWRWLVSFTYWPPYSRGKSPGYLCIGWLGRSQSRSRRCEKRNCLPTARNWTPVIQPVARLYTDWAIPVPHKEYILGNIFVCTTCSTWEEAVEFAACCWTCAAETSSKPLFGKFKRPWIQAVLISNLDQESSCSGIFRCLRQ
jgi:hypothetical protein